VCVCSSRTCYQNAETCVRRSVAVDVSRRKATEYVMSRVTSLSRDLVFISINHFRWHDVIVSSLDGGYSYDSTSTSVRFDGHSTAMWLSFDDEPQSNGSRTASRRSRIVVVTVISVTLYSVLGRQQWLDRNETKSKKMQKLEAMSAHLRILGAQSDTSWAARPPRRC